MTADSDTRCAVVRLGITGHQDLPPGVESYVRSKLREIVSSHGRVVGVGSLAVGADQIFAEVVLSLGGTIRIVVPAEDYRETFDAASAQRYDSLLARAAEIIPLPFAKSGEEAFMAAGEAVVRRCDRLIAVWDSQPARGIGGTADVVEFARRNGIPVSVVWPEGARR